MALRVSDEEYENANPDINPGQADYDQKFNNLNKAESDGNSTDNTKDNNSDSSAQKIKDGENNPDGDWKNNYSKEKSKNGKDGKSNSTPGSDQTFRGMLKKKGPLTAIILTIGGGGVGLAGLLSPGLLIVHMKEIMVDKFNTQLASMEIRTTKVLSKKLGKNLTSGVCTSVVSIKCKYSSMSNKQIAKLKNAGIEVETNGEKTILGRNKVSGVKFNNDPIDPDQMAKELRKNPALRAAVKKGFNPKWAGFWDKIGNKALFTMQITKKGITFKKGSDAEKLAEVQDIAKKGSPEVSITKTSPPERSKYTTDEDYNKAKADYDAAIKKSANAGIDTIEETAEKAAKTGTKSVGGALKKAGTAALETTGNFLKVTGPADIACSVYGMVRSLGFLAKVVRAVQLARYAMMFFNIADQIKGGASPNSEDVAYLGTLLVADAASTIATNGGIKQMGKTAVESFGYQYAAYGKKDAGPMSNTAMQFLAGGGLTGQLINITSSINSILGGSPKTACAVLNNTAVQVGSAAAGIALLIAGGPVTITAKTAINAAVQIAFGVALTVLPALLADLVAGVVVDKTTVGENVGDAITSGAGNALGTVAKTGGNGPLSPDQAAAYQNTTNEVLAMYAEEDRVTHSPFDISNRNTFLGSILFKSTPLIAKMSSPTGMLTSVASLVSGSLSSIMPTTHAADSNEYTTCADADYKEYGIAADPFCNIVYGIPPNKLNMDPNTVADNMAGEIDIDASTGEVTPKDKYKQYLDECVNRTDPIGFNGENSTGSDGSACKISDGNATFPKIVSYSLFQIDQRVDSGMSGDDSDLENGSVGATTSESSDATGLDPTEVPDGSAAQPPNTEKRNKGWVFKAGQDYSQYSCADESTEKRVVKNHKGTTIRTCDTALGEVASVISQRVVNMVAAAKKDGVILQGGGFRTYEEQVQKRKDNHCPDIYKSPSNACSPAAAIPGTSAHESGLAVDFTIKDTGTSIKGGGVENKWLLTNGSKFGFYNLPSESWHFSMSGS
ncbi:MAG: M15 family metallopeptidase [Candidatus Saccharibacteria bacterium]